MEEKKLYSIREAAEEKGVSRGTVWLAVKEGRLAATRVGTQYVIERHQLDAWQPSGWGGKRPRQKKDEEPR